MCLTVVFTAGNRKNMAATKSEKSESELQHSVIRQRVLWWRFIRATACSKKRSCFFLSKTFWRSDIYLTLIMHSILRKLSSFAVSRQQFQKLLQLLGELRTLHTVSTSKCAWIRFVYQLLIWSSRLWNSDKLAFFEVTWQQASKHINKSIIGATVSTYQ